MTELLLAGNPYWLTLPEPLTQLGNWAVIVLSAVGVMFCGLYAADYHKRKALSSKRIAVLAGVFLLTIGLIAGGTLRVKTYQHTDAGKVEMNKLRTL